MGPWWQLRVAMGPKSPGIGALTIRMGNLFGKVDLIAGAPL